MSIKRESTVLWFTLTHYTSTAQPYLRRLKWFGCITSVCRRLFKLFFNFFINNIYYNICSKSLKGSSRELKFLIPYALGWVCLLAPSLSGTIPHAYLLLTRVWFYFIIRYYNLPSDINCTIRFVDMSIFCVQV